MSKESAILIGNNMKLAREEKGLTRDDVLKKLTIQKIPYSTYANYENGNREPDTLTLKNIADALEVDVHFLLFNTFNSYSDYKKENLYIESLLDEQPLDSNEKLLLYDFRDTDIPKQTIVNEFLEHYKNHKNTWEYPNLSYEDYLKIYEYIDFLIHNNNQANKYFIDMQPNDENGNPISKEQWKLHFEKKYQK